MSQPRLLAATEIDYILDFIRPRGGIPIEVAIATMKIQKSKLEAQLKTIKIYPEAIDELKSEIMKNHYESQIHPGEAVGVIAAQSFGEMNTQNTLNSIDWNDHILYLHDGKPRVEPIGKMIDTLLSLNLENIEHIPQNRTEYLKIPTGYMIPSSDKNGNMGWYKIEAVTRHLPVGELVHVKTLSGREVTATQSKSFLVWDSESQEFKTTEGSNIKVGDILPTTSSLHIPKIEKQGVSKYPYTCEMGFLLGLFMTGGKVKNTDIFLPCPRELQDYIEDICEKQNINHRLFNKPKSERDDFSSPFEIRLESPYLVNFFNQKCKFDCDQSEWTIPEFLYTAPTRYLTGFFNGFFSCTNMLWFVGDTISMSALTLDILTGISWLLTRLGIFATVKYDQDLDVPIMIIEGIHAKNFSRIIGSIMVSNLRSECLSHLTFSESYTRFDHDQSKYPKDRDVYFDPVISVERVRGSTEYVYDLTVAVTRNFALWNGLNVVDTFHRAGTTNTLVVSGVGRFDELLGATKKPKCISTELYFKEGNSSVKELRKMVGNNFVYLSVDKLSLYVREEYDKEPEPWYNIYKAIYMDDAFENRPNCIVIKLDMEKLYEYSITIEDVSKAISEYEDLHCVFSPNSIGEIHVYPETDQISIDESVLYVTEENMVQIYMEELLKKMIKNLQVCGIERICNIFYTKDKSRPGEWMCETENDPIKSDNDILREIKCFQELLSHPILDGSRVTTNSIWTVYHTLGIDAAAKTLYNEFVKIMPNISSCHTKLLVNKMTYSGTILSINRYASRVIQTNGPMSQASFEESLDKFVSAAAYGDVESTEGVSAAIMCGKMAKTGTGICSMYMDINALTKSSG